MYKTINVNIRTFNVLEKIAKEKKRPKASLVAQLILEYDRLLSEANLRQKSNVNNKLDKIKSKLDLPDDFQLNLEMIDEGLGLIDEI